MELNIKYIRSLDESPEIRSACVTYLQNWLINFYPERMDLVKRTEELAKVLGGELHLPALPWKYSWLRMLFGWPVAKGARSLFPSTKWALVRSFDKALYQIQGRNGYPSPKPAP